jgi:sirohydrochlorin cobaltochelatase
MLSVDLVCGLNYTGQTRPRPGDFRNHHQAFSTYEKTGKEVKERFPGYEVRWAFTSTTVRRIIKQKEQKDLPSLPEVLQGLKKAGYTRIAVQSFLLSPGEEWENIS